MPPQSSSKTSVRWWLAELACAHPTHQAGSFDLAAAHAVDVATTRGFAILTAD